MGQTQQVVPTPTDEPPFSGSKVISQRATLPTNINGDAPAHLGNNGTRSDRLLTLARDIHVPIRAWLLHILLVFATVAITVHRTPDRDAFRPDGSGLWRYVISPLATWDGDWYVRAAREGYGEREATAAFWPFYPTLMDLGHRLTGLSHGTVGVVVSNLLFLGALIVLLDYVRMVYGLEIASRSVWIAALSPMAFFFSAAYTESLFLLLTVGAMALAFSGRWTEAALLVVPAVLTRNSGILILAPMLLLLVRQYGWNPRGWWSKGIQLAAAAMTAIAFTVHLDRVQGDPLLMVHAQAEWGRTQAWPWQTLADAVHRMHRIYATGRHDCEPAFDVASLRACQTALQLGARDISDDLSFVFTIGCLLVLPFAIWRLRIWDSCYLALGIVLPLFGPTPLNPLASMGRYLLVLFPLYVVLAMVLRRRLLLVTTLTLSALVMVWLLALFSQGYFVS